LILFKLKTGQVLNLDQVARISSQMDSATKQVYLDLEIAGRNVSIKDEEDLAAFAVITERLTPPRV
jgi:hypothetical protein